MTILRVKPTPYPILSLAQKLDNGKNATYPCILTCKLENLRRFRDSKNNVTECNFDSSGPSLIFVNNFCYTATLSS